MKQNKHDLDAIIDDVTRDIRDEQIDPSIISQSATRVWARVSQQAAENSSSANLYSEGLNTMNANNTEHIRGCDDFRSLIPAYLEGKLSTARTLLLEDHSNECIPCRQELKAQKSHAATKSVTYVRAQPASRAPKNRTASAGRWNTGRVVRWIAAAATVVCVALAGLFMYERFDLSGTTLAATVDNADGLVFVVSDAQSRQLAVGEQLQKGESVRTGKDSAAILRLADGSTVEMRERSEFSVTENMRGVTVRLDRGDVIVEAAKQHNGRLYVQTPDSLVSVKGTIFVVESGTKGSRVSVV
ncbi:MAG: FecR domain-containing protein, partial [Acidobacteriota bacterium]